MVPKSEHIMMKRLKKNHLSQEKLKIKKNTKEKEFLRQKVSQQVSKKKLRQKMRQSQ